MRIISRKPLKVFWERHQDCEQQLKAWYNEMKRTNYHSPNEIKERYNSADVVANNRIVFNIKGNKYRLVVEYKYRIQLGFIRFIGTHKEYDKINVETI